MSRKLFCDMNPLFFEISSKKEVLRRHIKNLRSKEYVVKYGQENKEGTLECLQKNLQS